MCRFVYNRALALQKENHAASEKFIVKFAMKKCFHRMAQQP
ncbi:helix-turn-helix domain-containing protein [Caballeronia sordidicola]|nr:helix-turn-helix domain-containing protein [Caballeronia sordidicola]